MTFRNAMQTVSLLVIAFLLIRGSCPESPPVVYSGDVADSLASHGYSPAAKDPQLPPFVKPGSIPGAKPIVSGSGTWTPDAAINPGDTLEVEVSAVIDPSGKPWLGVWINGKPVHWTEPPAILLHEETASDVSVIFEGAFVRGRVEPAVGASWTPICIGRTETGIGGSISLDGGSGHWGAAFGRVCGRLGPLDAGLDLGYRFGRDHGFHAGASLGLRIDI